MNKRKTYYGALVDHKPGGIPPYCYAKHHLLMDQYPDNKYPEYKVVITDSIQNRKKIQAIARELDCELWMVQRKWLKKKEIDEGLKVENLLTFRKQLSGGHIFPLVSVNFHEEVVPTVLKHGWFHVDYLTYHHSSLMTGDRSCKKPEWYHATVNYEQMQYLNDKLREAGLKE